MSVHLAAAYQPAILLLLSTQYSNLSNSNCGESDEDVTTSTRLKWWVLQGDHPAAVLLRQHFSFPCGFWLNTAKDGKRKSSQTLGNPLRRATCNRAEESKVGSPLRKAWRNCRKINSGNSGVAGGALLWCMTQTCCSVCLHESSEPQLFHKLNVMWPPLGSRRTLCRGRVFKAPQGPVRKWHIFDPLTFPRLGSSVGRPGQKLSAALINKS